MCGLGVKREGEKEQKEGAVDVEFNSSTSPYLTHKLTYTPEDFQRLIDLTSYNIQNNKDVILNALNKALNRNRERQTGDDSHGKKEKAAVGKTSSASTPKPGSQKTRKYWSTVICSTATVKKTCILNEILSFFKMKLSRILNEKIVCDDILFNMSFTLFIF